MMQITRTECLKATLARNWRLSSALAVVLLGFGNVQAEVSKWVDEKGAVHYGDAVPDKYRGSAKVMPPNSDAPSPAQERDAQLRLQEYTEALKATSAAPEPATPAIVDSPAPQTKTHDLSCDGQWQRYFDAQDCFGPYRIKSGAVKPEAFSACPVIKVPNCVARNAKPR
jgi:hypothetical protein